MGIRTASICAALLAGFPGSGVPSTVTRLSDVLPSMASGDPLVIGAGYTLLVDTVMTSAKILGVVTNYGSIVADRSVDIAFMFNAVLNYGNSDFGTDSDPLVRSAIIEEYGPRPTASGNPGGGPIVTGLTHIGNTPTGNNGTTNDNNGSSRAWINFEGSTHSFVGTQQGVVKTYLNANASSGTKTLVLADPVWWKAGQRFAIGPTSTYTSGIRTQVMTVAADTNGSNTVTTVESLGADRWGQLQYAVDPLNASDGGIVTSMSGRTFSMGPDRFYNMKAHASQTTNVIDQRAKIVLIDRNLTIRGANDSAWSTYRFGAHMMTMGIGSKGFIKNVCFERFGQRGLLGRYGVHWHFNSYNPTTGVKLTNPNTGLADGKFAVGDMQLENCHFHSGGNRAITLHACRGVIVRNNSSFNALGHALFEEDGSELYNTVEDNWMFDTLDPGSGNRLKQHDEFPAGIWIANWNNFHRRNGGIGGGHGFWNALSFGLSTQPSPQYGCLGASAVAGIPEAPFFSIMGDWDGNFGDWTSSFFGMTDDYPVDNEGNTTSDKVQTTSDGLAVYGPNQTQTLIKNMRGNGSLPYKNRIANPRYLTPITSDCLGEHFAGQTDAGFTDGHIAVRKSLNPGAVVYPVTNVKTDYHGLFVAKNLSAWGFSGGSPGVAYDYSQLGKNAVRGGWDDYLDGVINPLSQQNTNWKRCQSVGMWRSPSPNLIGSSLYAPTAGLPNQSAPDVGGLRRHFCLAGAIYDVDGSLSDVTFNSAASNGAYIIYNTPFLTADAGTTVPSPGDDYCVVSTKPFYGVTISADDSGDLNNQYRIKATRYDQSLAATADIWQPEGPGGPSSPNGTSDGGLPFQHCAVAKGSYVLIERVGAAVNSNHTFVILNNFINGQNDICGIGQKWSGTVTPYIYQESDTVPVAAVSPYTKAAFLAATTRVYWHDTANSILWLKCKDINNIYVPGYNRIDVYRTAL